MLTTLMAHLLILNQPNIDMSSGCMDFPISKKVERFDGSKPRTSFFSTFTERSKRDPEPGTEQETGKEWFKRLRELPDTPMEQRIVTTRPAAEKTYCRVVTADRQAVDKAVARAIRDLGYPIDSANSSVGITSTGFRDGRYSTAVWMDRYRVTVSQQSEGQFLVEVRRQVFVSRAARVYIQGTSDGHNERWLLTRVSANLIGG